MPFGFVKPRPAARLSPAVAGFAPVFVWVAGSADLVRGVVPTLAGQGSWVRSTTGQPRFSDGWMLKATQTGDYANNGVSIPTTEIGSWDGVTFVAHVPRWTSSQSSINLLSSSTQGRGIGIASSGNAYINFGAGYYSSATLASGDAATIVWRRKSGSAQHVWVNGVEEQLTDDSGNWGSFAGDSIGGTGGAANMNADIALIAAYNTMLPLPLCRRIATDPATMFDCGLTP